jgi:hypothetical protein
LVSVARNLFHISIASSSSDLLSWKCAFGSVCGSVFCRALADEDELLLSAAPAEDEARGRFWWLLVFSGAKNGLAEEEEDNCVLLFSKFSNSVDESVECSSSESCCNNATKSAVSRPWLESIN